MLRQSILRLVLLKQHNHKLEKAFLLKRVWASGVVGNAQH